MSTRCEVCGLGEANKRSCGCEGHVCNSCSKIESCLLHQNPEQALGHLANKYNVDKKKVHEVVMKCNGNIFDADVELLCEQFNTQ